MAFTRRLAEILPGFGIAGFADKSEGVSLTTSAIVPLPATGGFSRKMRSGFARFKAVKVSGTSITVALRVRVSDGTTQRVVANFPASAADEAVDYIFPIISDLDFDRLNFDATTGGTSPSYTVDVEFAGASA